MIPNTDTALRLLNRRLMTTLLPDLNSTFVQSDGMLLAMLIENLATEMATGIENRLQDIRDLKAIFHQAIQIIRDKDLDATLGKMMQLQPESMTLADVNSVHDEMQRTLIKLHEQVEILQHTELNDLIWQYLHDHSDRHQLTGG